ncbi:AI-2E family transporter [Devosia faecipullorum]|uniref:AI-2E family transporter n=1 Tax=Devosia faecipullorum TaxID=2755039 RepID=UPI00187B9297|nr:AI-2E family transporter [Devosia faecipullorum]MBE7732607.1 AI-2E family transporter [Devosia faecipullorum]
MTSSTRAIVTGVLLIAILALAWQVSTPILLIFAGILIACVLDAAVRMLGRVAPWPRPVLLVLVSLSILIVLISALSLGGLSLWRNIQDLFRLLIGEITRIYGELQELGLVQNISRSDIETMVATFFPDPGGLFNQASSLFGSTMGIVSNGVIIIFLGLFFAINPKAYRDGFLLLLPKAQRPRVSAALGDTGEALRGWMVTQLAMMVLIGSLVFLLLWGLGVPNAPVLGLLAGALNFIPFLGPIFSAVPVLLTLAAQDSNVLILGAIGLFLVQNLEGYILTPMLQQRIIRLSPAWSLSIMTILGTLFGIMGIALATPIYAVGRMLTLRLYIEPKEQGDDKAIPLTIKE